MKTKPWEVDRLITSLPPEIRVALVFGKDQGLIEERAAALSATIVEPPDDPFRLIRLAAEQLARDPARLADEAAAQSLTGGRRLLRIDNGGDGLAGLLAGFLEKPPGDGFVLLVAGDLPARSRLRKLIEKAANAVALPCYGDNAESLEALVRATLAAAGLRIAPDTMAALVGSLGRDRQLSRRELEKLVLYKLPGPGARARSDNDEGDDDRGVSLADVRAVIGDAAAFGIEAVIDCAFGGRIGAMDRGLARLSPDGQSAIPLLRGLARRLMRLDRMAAAMAAGETADQAGKRLRPPAFPREAALLASLARRWGAPRIARALIMVRDAEIACKTTAMPAPAICARTCLQIASAAANRPAKRQPGKQGGAKARNLATPMARHCRENRRRRPTPRKSAYRDKGAGRCHRADRASNRRCVLRHPFAGGPRCSP